MQIELPSGTPAHLARAEGAERGLVVVPDIWGLRPLFERMCHDLSARTGWSVVCFEPFPGQDLPGAEDPDGPARRFEALAATRDERLLGDAVAAADATGCAHVGLVGFCMGGMYALLASATGRFDRIVSFYGMIRVPEAWHGPGHGEPLDALARRGDARVMAVIGGLDAWTPPGDVAELEAAGVTVVRYAEADHGFVHDPDRPAHRPDDAADAWDRALAFLEGLTPPPA
jgi:carboxymethylenebutenolidase